MLNGVNDIDDSSSDPIGLGTVQSELTEHGNTLQTVINNLTDWGIVHRNKIVGK